ncbi:MAG: hypothetical protein HFJ30_00120 [Clostridia bacterium]|nr:hypothetical protein [Clostridia bacterium]
MCENTIKIRLNYNESVYEVDTKIKNELEEGKYYYLADNNKEPTKVKFMGYEIDNTIGADLIIVCNCLNTNNNKFEYYFTKSLYKSKDKACEAYLNNKYGGALKGK